MTRYPPQPPGIANYGLIRFVVSDCTVDKTFVSNKKFYVTRNKKYWKNGELNFPYTPYHYDLRYRTVYGMAFATDAMIYAATDRNLSLAMRRHTCKREPKIKGFDERLCRNQQNFCITKKKQIKRIMRKFDFTYSEDMRVAASIMKEKPHKKKKLRQQAWVDLNLSGIIGHKKWLRNCNWKLKTDEYAKPGKYGRIIVDLTCPASLQTGEWAEHAKKVLSSKPLEYSGSAIHFCSSPRPDDVVEYFRQLERHNYRIFMVVFSDDAIISIRNGNKYELANLDISSCDSSHQPAMFELFFDVLDIPKDIRDALITQIMASIKIWSVDRRHFIKMRPRQLYLQSGITITTILNTFAWFMMFIQMCDDNTYSLSTISKSCESVGYVVTVEFANVIQDIQFLKMSPCYDSECIMRSVLNLGVILRSSGVCKGDLPGRTSFTDKALKFQSALMNGFLKPIDYSPFKFLQPHETVDTDIKIDYTRYSSSLYFTEFNLSETYSYTRDEIYKRYGLTDYEITELETYIQHVNVGEIIYCSGASKILFKDYGLNTPLL